MLTGELPDQVDPDKVPGPLARVILKCVKARPEERYFSVDEFLQALAAAHGTPQGGAASEVRKGPACPACGAGNAPDARFCERCGVGLFRPCPECGKDASVSVKFCPACGTDTEGLARLLEAVGRMERFQAEKKYSRVTKEAGLLADLAFKARGANAQKALARAAALKDAAQSAESRIENLPGLIEQEMAAENLEAVPPLLAEWRDLTGDPQAGADIETRLPAALERRETRWWAAREARVRELCDRGEFVAALREAEKTPSFPPIPQADRAARKAALREEAIRAQVADHVRTAAAAMDEQEWDKAEAAASAALALTPAERAAQKILRQAREGIASRTTLAQALAAFATGDYARCEELIRSLETTLGAFKIAAAEFSGTSGELVALAERKGREKRLRVVRRAVGIAVAAVALAVAGFVTDRVVLARRIRAFEACCAVGRTAEALQLADRLGARYPAAGVWKEKHQAEIEERKYAQVEQKAKSLLQRLESEAATAKGAAAKALKEESEAMLKELAALNASLLAAPSAAALAQLRSAIDRGQAAMRSGPNEGQDWTSPETGMEFVWIPALKIWVGKYEATNAEYRKKVPDHDSKDYEGKSLNGDRQPVVYVSFDDAKAFADWMTQRDQAAGALPADCRYRLPSEQEWQAFAQCGDNREYPWGNAMPPKYGNYSDQSSAVGGKIDGYDDGFPVTCPVERSGKNDWGLYGVGGNVWEAAASDISGGSIGAWRGASWSFNAPDYLLCACRFGYVGSLRDDNYGFRLVLSR